MKELILLILGLKFALANLFDDNSLQITAKHIEELKSKVSFEIFKYENHPFKDWSVEGLIKKLGLIPTKHSTNKMINYGDYTNLPSEFDSRIQWPNCIHSIRDQERCGSCWAFAASEVLSDRLCIASNGDKNLVLSPQDLISCDTNNFGCEGGYIDKSWDYIRDLGIVTDECLPYSSGNGITGDCTFSVNENSCQKGTFLKYRVSRHGQHLTVSDAKNAILSQGPIEAGFDVYVDFLSYSSGVYQRSSDYLLGGHAVKVIGWGTTSNGIEYWIAANSWNTNWGENGFFRIAFGQCNFEYELWSGIPSLTS
jgi:cathepsin B